MTEIDPRISLHRAYVVAGAIVAGVGDDQWQLPTPCSDYDVRQLTAHIVGAAGRPAQITSGAGITGTLETPPGPPDGGYEAEMGRHLTEVTKAFGEQGTLEQEFTLPWGTFSGSAIAEMYAIEMAVHAWDLAVATGQDQKLDDELSEALLPAARKLIPAGLRGGEVPFAAVVDVDTNASASDQLAGFLGRSRP
ncbi:MAG: TIGR03086 family metal-binding protein [Acidimicrobiales bacterium]